MKKPKIIYREYRFKKIDLTKSDAFQKIAYNFRLQYLKAEDKFILSK